LGFIFGPAIGGVLSQWGYNVPAFAAAAIALLNLFAVFIWLPESLPPEQRTRVTTARQGVLSLQALWQAISRPRVGPLLQIRFFYGLAFSTFETMFALHALYQLELSAQITAYTMAYTGVLVVLVQGLAIGWLTARFRETILTFAAVLLLAISLLGWALVSTLLMLLIILIPIALAAGILNTIINSLLSKSVYPEEVGGTMGLSSSLESMTRIIAPVLGGIMLVQLGTWAPGVFGSLLMAWVLFLVWNRLISNPDPPLPQRQQNPELVH
jgi:DHA1 family tetracycline resistance protein-like MFS transporter